MSALQTLPLAVRERPPAAELAGTLVLLHGRGTDENDLFGLFDVLDPEHRLRGLTVGAPFTGPTMPGRHWYVVPRVGFPHPETFRHSYGALQRLLDERVDWSRTVVGGFSQGSVMSYALALGAGRPMPAGILAMSGFVPSVDGWQPELATRPRLPVWISHGELDPVISVAFAREARAVLEAGGLDVSYHETPMAHTIDPRLLPELQTWIAARV